MANPLRHIGILAHSADGAALCFLEAVRRSADALGAHEHPEITMSILPMGPTLALYEAGNLQEVNKHLIATMDRLAAVGCDFFICPDNTAHIALDAAITQFPLAGLHIARVVADKAKEQGFRKVALLGTKWTMEGPSYPAAFGPAGIEIAAPEKADRELINRVIFEELCQGRVLPESQNAFVKIISQMAASGCDAVALSCTEIPLLVTKEVSPLPILDSTRLLAREAVKVALGEKPLPTWRGGPAS